MDDCIFCKIIKKEIPAHVVYEDENFLAFLDIRPLSAGHTLVIPKEHFRWVWDVAEIGNYFSIVQKIAKVLQKSFGTEAIHLKIIGEEVPHAHVWLYPDPSQSKLDKNDLVGNLEKIKRSL